IHLTAVGLDEEFLWLAIFRFAHALILARSVALYLDAARLGLKVASYTTKGVTCNAARYGRVWAQSRQDTSNALQ
ncbi:MAG: hypothetical protein VX201_16990, partial [Pseudomonadota bacterium]|nr:hypothetical protein [Pseudomonadota bacterium]